jgi:uncharacterized protein (DUF488 family)
MYSIGHSVHPLDALVSLISEAKIRILCDIRRFPRSRRNPQFSRERLGQELPARGIGYLWLGETLGGFRTGGYEEWMKTEDFDRGLAELEELAQQGVLGFMCSEGSPDRCHRRFVASALSSRGHRIGHLLPGGEIVWVQPTLELPSR